MDRYVRHLDEIGQEANRAMRQRAEDFATISADPMFETTGFLGREQTEKTRDDAIRLFLARAAAFGTARHQTANFYYRRPCAGFHPQIYAHENSGRYDTAIVNPLAHFIRNGKPDGPWCHEVIGPSATNKVPKRKTKLRIALHAHFYYTELAPNFLIKLAANGSPCDLLLSTSDKVREKSLREATAGYDAGKVTIRIVPNRGRDIGPFLTAFAEDIICTYDIVGHVHGKRSIFTEKILGETWRDYLWENLLGGLYPMMDTILSRFEADEKLGIVFPDDPHLPDWDRNLEISTELARRMGIADPLPPFFDFPVGTMFWARTKALMPLFDLRFKWGDYPEEPVPIDGTLLHAIERLLPFAARHAGYRYATTHVPGITW
jgi:lipopolysaccharide biosynthesis protein